EFADRHSPPLRRVVLLHGGGAAKAGDVVWAAGLGPGARKALAAEWLGTDDGADLAAIDVDVADTETLDDLLHAVVDPRMQPEGEPVAPGIDCVDHLVEVSRLEGGHVQDRAEDFALEVLDAPHLHHGGADEGA